MNRGPLESETCRDVILPALRAAGWTDDQIRPQYPVKEQRVLTSGGVARDLPRGLVDYVLEIVPGLPVAVFEAKRSYKRAANGLQQSVRYAQQLDVPLAFASNGAEHIVRDVVAGTEGLMTSFPAPAEVWDRYVTAKGIGTEGARCLQQTFNRNIRTVGGDIVQPRWYQTVAVHRVLTAMARGQKRILLLMATGTGKTFTAMQLVHKLRAYEKLAHPERNYRVLYLADRDELVKRPQTHDFALAFGNDPLWRVAGGTNRSREIYFSTYQALSGGDEPAELFADYRPDFFDLIIVDECHRGSAAENSTWRRILEYFSSATQLGLTATPKQDDTIDTFAYFGDAVFSYSLRRGIEDGYLAPYRLRRVALSPDVDGWEPDPGQLDDLGREIPDGKYSTRDYERLLRLLARTDLAAKHLTRILRADPDARALVFCVNQQHADDMRRALVNANADLLSADPEWVVRITGDEPERVRLLEAFTDPESWSPTVVTTSRLLSTGIDVQDLKYVVLFRAIGSAVEFKQIVGRGTRLYPDKGKTSFEIIDYVGASRHFEDPGFDGDPIRIIDDPGDPDSNDPENGSEGEAGGGEAGGDVVAEPVPPFDPANPDPPADGDGSGNDPDGPPVQPYVVGTGQFSVVAEAVMVPDTSTGALVLTEYGEYVAGVVRQIADSAVTLSERWARRDSRREVVAELREAGVDLGDVIGSDASGVDPFDVLIQIAWNVEAPTRAERARRAREAHYAELERMSQAARDALAALLDRYAAHGVDDLESPEVVHLPPLSALGSPRDLREALRELGGVPGAVDEVEAWVYSSKLVS